MATAQSNRGIVLAANSNASSGFAQIPTAGALVSAKVAVQIGQRAVFTLSHIFGNQTSYVYRVLLQQDNLYGTIGQSPAATGQALPGTATDPNLNIVRPVLSVAQNDDSTAGALVLDHTYASPTTTDDIIEVAGPLAGLIMIQVTTAGPAPSATAQVKVSLDVY